MEAKIAGAGTFFTLYVQVQQIPIMCCLRVRYLKSGKFGTKVRETVGMMPRSIGCSGVARNDVLLMEKRAWPKSCNCKEQPAGPVVPRSREPIESLEFGLETARAYLSDSSA